MISEAFVWIYLPNHTEPVVCGRLFAQEDGAYSFIYGRSYRDRNDSIPLSPDTMPLGANLFTGRRAGALPGPIRDASPDAWGRYVAEYRRGGLPLDELDVLLSGDGDRIGALAFSNSATECRAPESPPVTLVDMEAAARGVRWEAATLSLARAAGIRVPRHRLEQVNGRDVLLVERFDRENTNGVRR